MRPPEVSPKIVRFGVFEIDHKNAELRKHGVRLRIQQQPFQILAALLDHAGEVVAREDLIARLWPDGTVVDFDRGLNAAVTRLRQVLSDSADTPKYVETVAGRGYRFIASVEPARNGVNAPAPPAPRQNRLRSMWPAVVLFSIAANGRNDLVPLEPQRCDAREGDQLHPADVGYGAHDDARSLGGRQTYRVRLGPRRGWQPGYMGATSGWQ